MTTLEEELQREIARCEATQENMRDEIQRLHQVAREQGNRLRKGHQYLLATYHERLYYPPDALKAFGFEKPTTKNPERELRVEN